MELAYCGLDCSQCPSYLATQNDDDLARAKTAAYYNKKYGFSVSAKEINCDGCKAETGRHLGYCGGCAVRKCGAEKEVETCADCPDQPCDKLTAFHEFSPDAKKMFQRLLT